MRRLFHRERITLTVSQLFFLAIGLLLLTNIPNWLVLHDNSHMRDGRCITVCRGAGEEMSTTTTTTPSPEKIVVRGNVLTINGSAIRTPYPVTLDSPYLLNNPNICKNVSNVDVLIVVHTSLENKARRNLMRETWADPRLFEMLTTRVVFFFGVTKNTKLVREIAEESKKHGDMVQSSFMDTYKNLTNKGVLVYRWVSEFCQNSRLVMKVDDDMFVDIFKVVKDILPKFRTMARTIQCQVRWKNTSPIMRAGKWAVDNDQFRNMTDYPVPYCNGFFVLMTSDIIKAMFAAARITPFFWVDDVYLYGLLPLKVDNVTFINQIHITPARRKIGCYFHKSKPDCERKDMVAFGASGDVETEKVWLAGRQN